MTKTEILLKEMLPTIKSQIDTVDPVIAKIPKTTRHVYGKEVNIFKPVPIEMIADLEGHALVFRKDLDNFYAEAPISKTEIQTLEKMNLTSPIGNLTMDYLEKLVNNGATNVSNRFYWDLNHLFHTTIYCKTDLEKYEILPKLIKERFLTLDMINEFIEYYNPNADFVLCNSIHRLAFAEWKNKNNIQVRFHKSIPEDEIYCINTQDFIMSQLCDWEWITTEKGEIIRLNNNTTLAKYANFICMYPEKQLKIQFIRLVKIVR